MLISFAVSDVYMPLLFNHFTNYCFRAAGGFHHSLCEEGFLFLHTHFPGIICLSNLFSVT